MSTFPPEVVRVDVGDAELGVVRWRADAGAPVVFAIHSFSSNAWSWAAVARHIDGRASIVAIDLRGRGFSHDVDGPFGIRQHAADVATVIRRFNASPAVVTGHSMGAFVALAAAERSAADVADIVLVDGGAPIPIADGADPQDRLDELLGSAIARLGRVWTDRVAYRSRWTEHPAFRDLMTPEVERYALSDLIACEGGFRSRVAERGVRIDGAELLVDPDLRAMLGRSRAARIVLAESGPDTGPPLVDDATVAAWPQHHWRRVPDTNHYSVVLGEPGAAIIAEELLACVG